MNVSQVNDRKNEEMKRFLCTKRDDELDTPRYSFVLQWDQAQLKDAPTMILKDVFLQLFEYASYKEKKHKVRLWDDFGSRRDEDLHQKPLKPKQIKL